MKTKENYKEYFILTLILILLSSISFKGVVISTLAYLITNQMTKDNNS